VPTAQQTFNTAQDANFKTMVNLSQKILPGLESGDFEGVRSELVRTAIALDEAGAGNTDVLEAIDILNENPENLLNASKAAVAQGIQRGILGTQKANIGFGAQETFKDEKGNLFFGTQRLNRNTGDVEAALSPVSGGDAQPVGQLSLVSGIGQTAQEKQASTIETARATEAAKLGEQLKTKPTIKATEAAQTQAIKKSGAAFDRLEKIGVAISNIDEGIRLIDEGASTGVIASRLPSIKKASIELDNLQKRLGLDVVSDTTFGALSESELSFALDSALPKNLSPPDLRDWLVRKKEAQQKLANYLGQVATFLGTPGNTVADFIELQKLNRLKSEQQAPPQQSPAPQQGTAAPANIGRFTIEVLP